MLRVAGNLISILEKEYAKFQQKNEYTHICGCGCLVSGWGPTRLALPFGRSGSFLLGPCEHANWEYKALITCDRRAGTPHMGGPLARYRPGENHLWKSVPIIPGRSGLGRNSVGSTYRGLWRERTALRALILCTRCTEIPACVCFRRAYRARAICVTRPLLPQNFKLSR